MKEGWGGLGAHVCGSQVAVFLEEREEEEEEEDKEIQEKEKKQMTWDTPSLCSLLCFASRSTRKAFVRSQL